jgi:hypothetical protein
MRKAVTFLQSVARFRANMTITAADVHEITGVRKRINCRETMKDLFLLSTGYSG